MDGSSWLLGHYFEQTLRGVRIEKSWVEGAGEANDIVCAFSIFVVERLIAGDSIRGGIDDISMKETPSLLFMCAFVFVWRVLIVIVIVIITVIVILIYI